MNPTEELRYQVMWNRLISIVEEQALTLVRTSFSTSVREAGDLSAGVFDQTGRMVAQAVTGTPGHVNTMAAAVGHFINDIGPERIYPGDVYITNDPWKGTGHLHDITVTTPVFTNPTGSEPTLIGFFASTAHVVDVGGRGYGPEGREVYEEGLRIPIMKWAQRGDLNTDLVGLVRANVREADQVVGDIHGLAASNETGRRRLLAMLDEFSLERLDELAEFVFDRTRTATLNALQAVPAGTYHNTMTVDGYDTPITLQVALTVSGEGMHADFTGTSPISSHGVNVPLTYAQAYFTYAMLVALAPELPNNFASLEPFTVSAPPGVILNAQDPDPVSVRHVIGHFVTDLSFGAIAQARPEVVPAEGAGALWNFQASARQASPDDPKPPVEVLMFNSGGTGARPTLDGLTATAFPSGVRTMSAEATEQVGPIVIWRKEIRENSGGAGQFRGGLGQTIEIGPADGYQFEFSAMFDRVDHPARGRAGGADGQAGRVYLDDGTPFPTKGVATVAADRRLIMELPGGGGFGDPADRDPEAVTNDLRQGYVS
jgi:N-methylhydantoinase B